VLALGRSDRSSHFIGKVADWEQLWGAKNEDCWLVPMTPDNVEYFPVWPHPEYADRIIKERYPDYRAVEISTDEFISHWLPTLKEDSVKVAVFPDEDWVF